MNEPMSETPPTLPYGSRLPTVQARLAMDGFIPNELLSSLLEAGLATVASCMLTTSDGRRYVLQHAARILGTTTGNTDPFGFTGLVESLADLLERGFVICAERVALGRHIYDVEYGVLAYPLGSADDSGVNPRIAG